VLENLQIAKGTDVLIPIATMNKSVAIWGPTAHDFDPKRWLSPLPATAQEIQGTSHLLTFIDGPRHCIGKNFALLEFKIVLATLIRAFAFAPTEHEVVIGMGFLPRPKSKGTTGQCLLLRVRHC